MPNRAKRRAKWAGGLPPDVQLLFGLVRRGAALSRGALEDSLLEKDGQTLRELENAFSPQQVAHVVERTGLALAGGSSGLFVAAHVARSDFSLRCRDHAS